ncbi:MAG TPA: HEAT repeat domain-containing protein [Isosphaeraceae bacterium]|jgi:HEAT repeat protein|nr:HEAT repeat domain-containing protein [Isosphaeraceae bacterium]
MKQQFLKVPRLRVLHLLVLVAVIAAFLAVFRFRTDVYTPLSRELHDAKYGHLEERRKAIAVLGGASTDRPEVVPTLLAALDDPDMDVRRKATESLGLFLQQLKEKQSLHPRTEEVKARLTEQLRDDDRKLRMRSAMALLRLDDLSEPMRDVLIAEARNTEGGSRREAVLNLGAIFFKDERAAVILLASMRDPNPEIRTVASYALALLARQSSAQAVPDSVVEALTAGLDDEEFRVRDASASGVKSLGKRARRAIPGLIRMLDDPSADRRAKAIDALRSFKESAEPAIPALRGVALQDPESRVRREAEAALAQIETGIKEFRDQILPELISELSDDEASRRQSAAQVLLDYGPMAKEAAPALRLRLADPVAKVRIAAKAALGALEPPSPLPAPGAASQ